METSEQSNLTKIAYVTRWILLAALILFALTVAAIAYYRTMQLTNFSGDEGLFAYMSRFVLRGGALYADLGDNKPPGLFILLAPFVAIFGNTPFAIRFGNLLITLLFVGVMTALSYQITRSRSAVLIAFILALIYSTYNNKPETTFTMTTMSATAALLAVGARGRILGLAAAGLVFALAMWTKQPIALELPILLALAIVYAPEKRLRAALVTFGGFLIGCGLMLAWLVSNDAFDDFWFYTMTGGYHYMVSNSGQWHFDEAASTLFQRYFVGTSIPFLMPLLILGAVAIVVLLVNQWRSRILWIVLVWALLGFIGASLGRSLRADYYQQMLPALILLIALAVPLIRGVHWQIVLLIIALVFSYRFVDRHIEPFEPQDVRHPLNAHVPAAEYIMAHSEPDDCIWTWGYVLQVLYAADRDTCQSAIHEGFVMDSEGFLIHEIRREYMDELLATNPALLIFHSDWDFYPELQKYADRYVTELAYQDDFYDVYQIDRSMWRATNVNFNGEIALIGYDLPAQESFCPGDELPISLTWQQLDTPEHEYQFFAQVLTADETARIAGYDGLPEEDRPTYTWVNTGEAILGEPFTLTLPESVEPGMYPLVVGLYDVETLDRLPVLDANGQPGGTYSHLQTIQVDDCEPDG